MSLVTLWTDWECKGGTTVGAVTVVSGSWGQALDGTDACEFVVVPDSRVDPELRQVLRIDTDTGETYEYRVQYISRATAGANATVTRTVRGLSPLADLGTSGLVRTVTGGATSYYLVGIGTPTDFLDDIILTNLAADGLDWVSRGTVDVTTRRNLFSPSTGWTHLQWLRDMEKQMSGEVRLRRNGATGYYIDFLAQTGSDATTVQVAEGRNLLALQDTRDDGEMATAVSVLGIGSGNVYWGIGENAWTVGAIPGSPPYWIPLTDPDGVSADPIALDDMVNGYYLLLDDATTLEITDSRASDSAVLVSATTGLTAGDLVQIVKDSDATRLTELADQNAARLFKVDTTSTIFGNRNLARNGVFNDVTSLVPDHWSIGASTGAWTYPRDSASTYTLTGGNASVSSTTVTITAGPANHIIYEGEWVRWGGTDRLIGATTQLDGSGTGTMTMFTAVAVANGTSITEASGFKNLRNMTWPSDGLPNAAWVQAHERNASQGSTAGLAVYSSTANTALISPAFTVKYVEGITDYIAAYATFSVRTSTLINNRDVSNIETYTMADTVYRQLPSMQIGTGASTLIARDLVTTPITANSEAHVELSCVGALTTDTAVRLALFGTVSKTTSSTDPDPACILRSATLAVTNSVGYSASFGDSPLANINWHRTTRALLTRKLSTVKASVTLYDFYRLTGSTREEIVLGGEVELVDLGLTARVVAIKYDYQNPWNTQVVIDSRPKRLIQFLAENV